MTEKELNTIDTNDTIDTTDMTDKTDKTEIDNGSNKKKKSVVDFSKTEFNQDEKLIIKKEVELIKEKYPHHIPILIRSNKINFTQYKYLVNEEVTISEFMMILKKKIKLNSYEAIYLFINNSIPKGSSQLNNLYNSHKDLETNMLIINVCKENTFGA